MKIMLKFKKYWGGRSSVNMYKFYLKADEMEDDNRHKHNVTVIDDNDMEINVNTLARFEKYLQ
uniref:Uncharacterized protein n=1 Tax=Salix viminalis TaxID=40686 RepID=A0A6N2KZZ2_SALVM